MVLEPNLYLPSHLLCKDRKQIHHYLSLPLSTPSSNMHDYMEYISIFTILQNYRRVTTERVTQLLASIHVHLHNSYTESPEASCHSRPQQFRTRRTVALPNGAKVWPFRRTRWRLLSGISLPRTHCHTTNGNPRQSRIPFQRNVCERLSRRTVIGGRTGLTSVSQLKSGRNMGQIRNCCNPY